METVRCYSRARDDAVRLARPYARAPARSFLSLVGTETKIAVCVLGEKIKVAHPPIRGLAKATRFASTLRLIPSTSLYIAWYTAPSAAAAGTLSGPRSTAPAPRLPRMPTARLMWCWHPLFHASRCSDPRHDKQELLTQNLLGTYTGTVLCSVNA